MTQVIDLPTKYDTLAKHTEHIGYYRRDNLEWYGIASYAVEDAEDAKKQDEIPEYLAQFMTPKHLMFIVYTDDDMDEKGTTFSAVPIGDNGKQEFTDHGIFSRFNWLLEVTKTFDDVPFKCSNQMESCELAVDTELSDVKAYFENKGFKVKLDTWE
jgi:hypothetical protein